MTRAAYVLSAFLGVAIAFALSGCPQPLPPTPPPGPVADAAPADNVFYGKTVDCTGIDTSSAQPYALTCADMENTGVCLINYVNTGVPAALMACAARDAEMLLFVAVANGTASDITAARATRLRAWFWQEQMTLRSAP
jgi:hypothetical protein